MTRHLNSCHHCLCSAETINKRIASHGTAVSVVSDEIRFRIILHLGKDNNCETYSLWLSNPIESLNRKTALPLRIYWSWIIPRIPLSVQQSMINAVNKLCWTWEINCRKEWNKKHRMRFPWMTPRKTADTSNQADNKPWAGWLESYKHGHSIILLRNMEGIQRGKYLWENSFPNMGWTRLTNRLIIWKNLELMKLAWPIPLH